MKQKSTITLLTALAVAASFLFATGVSAQGSRVTDGLVVLYEFSTGSGEVVSDVSDKGTPMDLSIGDQGAVTWIPGGGLSLNTATIISSIGPGSKVIDAVTITNAITIEAWLAASSLGQTGPARIVSCSADLYTRNFTLGQSDSQYEMRLRTTSTSDNGVPATITDPGTLATDLTHVVYTRDAAGAVTVYLDGVLSIAGNIDGTFDNWDAGYGFALGNELSMGRPWLGSYYLVAVYDRALPAADIEQNFTAGLSAAVPSPMVEWYWVHPTTGTAVVEYTMEMQSIPMSGDTITVIFPGLTAMDAIHGYASTPYPVLGEQQRIKVFGMDSDFRDGPWSIWSNWFGDDGPPGMPGQPQGHLVME